MIGTFKMSKVLRRAFIFLHCVSAHQNMFASSLLTVLGYTEHSSRFSLKTLCIVELSVFLNFTYESFFYLMATVGLNLTPVALTWLLYYWLEASVSTLGAAVQNLKTVCFNLTVYQNLPRNKHGWMSLLSDPKVNLCFSFFWNRCHCGACSCFIFTLIHSETWSQFTYSTD